MDQIRSIKFQNDYNWYCSSQFELFFKNYKKKNYRICTRICSKHIEISKMILSKNLWTNESNNNVAYTAGVLFQGLSEFILLAGLTRDEKWHLENKRTERIWGLMWNCIDRFNFVFIHFKNDNFKWIINRLNLLKENFVAIFGYGLFSSPEIMISKETCNICQKDVRACEHLNGKLYNGVMCSSVAEKFELRSVSLVRIPRDPRCRIWKWNMTEENTYGSIIMTLFRIDDWLIENKF